MQPPVSFSAPEFPEILAMRALGFLMNDRGDLGRFLAQTRVLPSDLARLPIRRDVLAAVLDFLIADEESLKKFARIIDLPLEATYEARRIFDGKPKTEISQQSHSFAYKSAYFSA